jgi:hypothetical protein
VTATGRNSLLLWSIVAFVGYWSTSAALPGPYFTAAGSLSVLIFGGVTLMRYAPEAWHIVVHQRRNQDAPEGDGSHLAAYGVTLIAAGCVYSGIFGLLWIFAGQPEAWLSTAASGFGRFVQAAGFGLLFFSPDVTKRGLALPPKLWLALIAAAIMMVGVFVGVQIGQKGKLAAIVAGHETTSACPPATPIKGNVSRAGLLFHRPGSRFYEATIPEACYPTEGDARRAGYRPAS